MSSPGRTGSVCRDASRRRRRSGRGSPACPATSGSSSGSLALYVTNVGGLTWEQLDPIAGTSATPPPSPCLASALTAETGRQGETGVVHGDVLLTNVGSTPCVLNGPPVGVELLRADGKALQTDLI